jgi:hypothetical protein
LKLTTKQIKNVIDKYTQKTINEQASPDSMGQNKQQSKLKDLMITDSASAKYKVAIMTKAASEVADASKKINIPTSLNKPYIFKPSN